ncbi:EthD family reductase [Amycolatopsis sp. NPDC051903]|uniref:EthD family reductase n=1 Tax=Amycolatopsis sp. NPDC051903 TaxID=3363936 RepID=UPI0037AFADE0
MHRLTVLYRPPVDPKHFREYYVTTHLPLAAKLPGLIRSDYSLDVAALGDENPYFAVFHGDFESAQAMAAALASAEGKAVARDVPNYATGGVDMIHYALA